MLTYRQKGLLDYFGQLRNSAEVVANLQVWDPPCATPPAGQCCWAAATAGTAERDELLDVYHWCGAEGWDGRAAGSCPAVLVLLWSQLCLQHWQHGRLLAACAGPRWVFRRSLSNVFQELLADHSPIICFKR